MFRHRPANSEGERPIMVLPLVSKLSVHTTGRPVTWAPASAASTSSREDMVSTQSRSAPPSASARAWSAKTSQARSIVRAPSGAKSSPVGPMEPATRIGRSLSSATRRAMRAAATLSSATRSWLPCSARR